MSNIPSMDNFTQNPFSEIVTVAAGPLGAWFWGIFFGLFILIIYVKSDKNPVAITVPLIIFFSLCGVVLVPEYMGNFFMIFAAMVVTAILYYGFIKKGRNF